MNGLVDGPDLNKEVVVGEKDENYKLSVGRREETVEKHVPAERAACEGSGGEGDPDEKMEHAPQGGGSEAKDEFVCVAESSALVPDGEGGAGNEVVVKAPVEVVQVVSEGLAEGAVPLEERADVKDGGGDEVANAPIPDGAASVAVPDGRGDVSDPVTEKVAEVVREGVIEEVVVVVEKRVEVETICGDIDGNNLGNSNIEDNNSADEPKDLSVDDDPKKQKIADVNASAQAGFGLATGVGSSDVENDGVKLDQTAEDKAKGPDFAVGGEGSSSFEVVKLDQTAEDKTKGADFAGGGSADLGKAQAAAAVVEVTRLEKIEVVESELIAVGDGSDLVVAKASVSSGVTNVDHVSPDGSEKAEESRKEDDGSAAEQSNGTSVSPAEEHAEVPLPDRNDDRLVQTTGTEGIACQDEGSGGEGGGANALHEHEDENAKEQTLNLESNVDHSKNVAVTSSLAEASSMDGQHSGTGGNPTDNNTLDDGKLTSSVSDGLHNARADDSKVNDSLAGETQNNGGIETNGNADVGHQNVKKEDSALGKHDVTADGDESEEAKSDEKIELVESISEEKSDDHVAGMDQADDVSDEKVHESKDMETDEGFEDDEVHEMSYFEEVLPEDVLSQEDTFSVGDIIWGKIRSHPWWPGQIFDASDSSEKALKYSKRDTFLIAYFGDRTFAWCDESQLKSFWTNFARMEKQSSSNAFLNAMDCALEEVARRTELGVTCSCFPEEAYKKLKSPEVENAGIREGITVPDDVGRSLSVASFKPEKFLEYVKELALFSPKKRTNRLELTFVQAQLSAFYSAKGYLNLPAFHIYGGLSGDETGLSPLKESRSGGSVGIATPSPRREEPTTPASLAEGGEGKSHASSSRKRKRLLEESPHRSRKQRSLAELMDMKGRQRKSQKSKSVSPSSEKKKDSESVLLSSGKKSQKFESSLSSGKKKPKSESKLSSGKKNQKSKSISPSSGKKKKDSDSAEFSHRRGRRRSISGDAETTGEEALDAASSGKGKKSKTGSNARETSKKKRRRFDSCENVETAGEEAPDDVSGGVSKASKKPKSRLVSPPSGKRQEKDDTIATPGDSTQKKRISNLSGNIDAETPPLQKSFKIGDRITKVASQLTGPPIIKCNSDASQKDLTDVKIVKDNRRGSATPLTPRASSDKKKGVPRIDSSSDEMLALLGTAAENPLKGIDSSSEVIDFFTDFRSSLYEKGSSNKRYKKSVEKRDQDQKSGGKTSSDSQSEGKKSSDAKPRKGKSAGSKTTVDYSSPEEGSSKTGQKRKAKSSKESPVKKQKFTSQQSTSPSVGLKRDSEREPAVGVTDSELSKDLQEENRTGNLDEKSGEECSPTALILTFTEGDTLPSEADLSRIFSRYGPLEESETEVLRKTSRARVVFKKRPDAEVAFSSAGKFSIFGPSLVSYRLRYLSSTSKDSPRSAMRGIKEAASADGNIKSPFPG
ncbi:PWWP domain-containing protein 3-like [Nymphaea colorata]|uniref:PWWP domain-containing protein n=1 Tax=Nymphaea colorata TaxID=210225 RepID=A0A5K1DID3_9MAGN|nr:PWWP domain-containing protein 3-like [Nymphaea colorata]XP_031485216.1 PWWP domain-containing protein 3-like [Nymphaea colorata]